MRIVAKIRGAGNAQALFDVQASGNRSPRWAEPKNPRAAHRIAFDGVSVALESCWVKALFHPHFKNVVSFEESK